MTDKQKRYTLKELRQLKRLTVDGCMLVTGLSRASWYRVELGQSVIFTNELKKIARLAGIKFEQLDTGNLKVGERDCMYLREHVQ